MGLEILITVLIIDAQEEWNIVIVDVLGAYLNGFMSKVKFVLIMFENEFDEIICEVETSLTESIIINKNSK